MATTNVGSVPWGLRGLLVNDPIAITLVYDELTPTTAVWRFADTRGRASAVELTGTIDGSTVVFDFTDLVTDSALVALATDAGQVMLAWTLIVDGHAQLEAEVALRARDTGKAGGQSAATSQTINVTTGEQTVAVTVAPYALPTQLDGGAPDDSPLWILDGGTP